MRCPHPAFAIALAVLFGARGCVQRACSDAGCSSGISAKIVGQPGVPASVSVCFDGSCAVAPWPTSRCEVVETDFSLSVCLQDDGSMIKLEFPADARVEDGMKFEIVMEDAAGETLLHESETVEFSDSYPNGKPCPGHCRYANYRY
jgi:hypothetical protein